jgi:DNA-binding NarL/FixJ family response regulator
MNEIKVVLVDDHKMFRDGIKSVLSDNQEIRIVGEAGTADELFVLLKTRVVDIVITDITMPGMSGIDLCKIVTEKYPKTKVLMLSMHNNEEFVMNSIKSGASGYLPKETGHEELVFV